MTTVQQKHLFIIDPLASLNPTLDTSLGLARALIAAGCEVWTCQLSELFWSSAHDCVHAYAQQLGWVGESNQLQHLGNSRELSCVEFHSVQMRKDPPFDIPYIAATWLLDSLRGKTRVMNAPAALRSINEKIGIFQFPHHAQPSLVSADPHQLLGFIKSHCQGDGISKPLDSFGGRGVMRIDVNTLGEQEALRLLSEHTENKRSLRMVQAFSKEIFKGEVRAFTVGGTPLAWCLKKPASGSYLANTRAGAELLSYKPSAKLVKVITTISRDLWHEHGLAFVGYDIIDEKITEINITSPRLLQGKDDATNYYQQMAQWLMSTCNRPLQQTQGSKQ